MSHAILRSPRASTASSPRHERLALIAELRSLSDSSKQVVYGLCLLKTANPLA